MRHMYTSKRNVRVIGMSLLLFLICSLHGWAQEGELTITATDPKQTIEAGADYTYESGVLTVTTTKPVTITSNGQKTSDRIVVPADKIATITLNNVNIESNYGNPKNPGGALCMVDASVTLTLEGTNVLAARGSCVPAISTYRSSEAKTSSLTIKGTGSLRAVGGDNESDGIGSYSSLIDPRPAGGSITIENGTLIGNNVNNYKICGDKITVNGGIVACPLDGSTVTINKGEISKPIHGGKEVNIHGGKVTAYTYGPTVNITGGLVNIVDDGACISGTNIIISGGIVILNGGKGIPGMGYTINGQLTTTNSQSQPGNAFIIVKDASRGNEISDRTEEKNWSGVIFLGDEGKVYGNSITLPEGQMSIPSGATLTVELGKTLTIGENSTLLVEGAASTTKAAIEAGKIVNNGTIENAGTIGLQGTFTNDGTYTDNSGSVYGLGGSADGSNAVTTTEGVIITFNGNAGSESVYNLPSSQIITKSTGNPIKPTLTPTRIGYTFIGWSESNSGNTIIQDAGWSSITSSTDKSIYALWKYNPVITITDTEVNYGSSTGATVSVTGSGGSLIGASIMYYTDKKCTIQTNTSNSGASSEGGVPKNIGTYYIKVNYSGDNDNMNAESIIPYTIKAMELTVNTGTITKVYDGNTTVDMSGFTLSGVASGDEQGVTLNTSNYSLTYASADVAAGINLTASGSLSLEGDKSGNYSVKLPTVLTGDITAKELTITPIADQTIYSDEHPAYTYSGQVGGEKPAFTGNLKEDKGKIANENLKLADNEASGFKAANYTLKLSSTDVTITVEGQTLTEAYTTEATNISSVVGTEWHKAAVTLTPSTGFKIKGSSVLKSLTDEWKDNLVVDGKDGTYEVTYQLKRVRNILELDAQTAPSTDQKLTVQLDKTVPVVAVATNKLTATVTLSDATSGLASYEYTWNNGGKVTESIVAGAKSHSITLTATAAGSYPLEIKVADKAGNETTYNKTIVLKEDTPPTPPTPPTPVYTYYDVTLPAIEGATTDPKAGTHKVMEGNRFIFSLTLDADYSESVPLVTIDGTVLTPRESDGKYVTDRVWSDKTIEISGIVKNTPTANEDLNASASHIYQTEGTLCIDIPQPLEGKVYSPAGNELRALRLSAGTNRVYGLPQGVCIVRLSDGTTKKVIITTH